MYKVDEKIRHIIRSSMKTWTVLECDGSELEEINIRRGIFQVDILSPLIFFIAMLPILSILRRAAPEYVFKNKTMINHRLYIDDLKLFRKTKKVMKSLMNRMQFGDD